MAWTVTEIANREATTANDGSRVYARTFRVVSSSAQSGQLKALEAPDVPEGFAVYTCADSSETDPEARVIRKTATQEDDEGRAWLVRVEYSTDWIPYFAEGNERGDPSLTAKDAGSVGEGWTPPSAPNLPPEQAALLNPILRPPEISKSSKETQKPFTEDLDGFPVVTSSNETFDPPPTIEGGATTITITRNVPHFDISLADRYRGAVNEEVFFGFQPGHARLVSYNAVTVYENRIKFERVTWTFECTEGTDQEHVSYLNQGFRETDADASLAAGFQVTRDIVPTPARPVLLDADGFQLVTIPLAPPTYERFRARVKRNFADLGVPTA